MRKEDEEDEVEKVCQSFSILGVDNLLLCVLMLMLEKRGLSYVSL